MDVYYDQRNDLHDRDHHHSHSSESSQSSTNSQESKEEVTSPHRNHYTVHADLKASCADPSKPTSLSRTKISLRSLIGRTSPHIRNKRRPGKHPSAKTRQKTRPGKP